ncbi:MAG: hypothetical protein RL757_798 [Bacteroidota bacterium]|jgi:hypothetical protein
MTKEILIAALREKHELFSKYIQSLSDSDFEAALPKKWSAGQQMEHIQLAVKPLNLAFWLPKFMLKMNFGTANRPSRTYEALVERYNQKLANGGRATRPFVPKSVTLSRRNAVLTSYEKTIQQFLKRVSKLNESDLDVYIIPHPLLGKLTLREMLYFTLHHVQHHAQMTAQNLSK